MKHLVFFILLCAVGFPKIHAQNFYRYDNGQISITEQTSVKDTLIFHADTLQNFSILANPIPMILSALVPKLVENIPKLFYNPENYIKETLVSRSVLQHNGSYIALGELQYIEYQKLGNNQPLALFNFAIGDAFMEKGYLDISLKSAKINQTAVRLKPQNYELNVVIEVLFHYYNNQQQKLVHAVEPFVLNNVTTGPYHVPKNQKIRLIPKFELLERIDIKVTEVNSRKKDWDAFLSLYQQNAPALQNYILGLLPQ